MVRTNRESITRRNSADFIRDYADKQAADAEKLEAILRKSDALGINLKGMIDFIVKAKTQSYAGDGKPVRTERRGFKELVFKEGPWEYRDSYAGFYCAPGQEVVRFNGKLVPVWVMSYSGGMTDKYLGDVDFSKRTFDFLKAALSKIQEDSPFRGPNVFEAVDKLSLFNTSFWYYSNESQGDVTDFRGAEKIEHSFHGGIVNRETVFRQEYIGGLVFPKEVSLTLRK